MRNGVERSGATSAAATVSVSVR
jgi:hypothetical protein